MNKILNYIPLVILTAVVTSCAWTPEGHEKLANKLLSHPTISKMIEIAGFDKGKVIEYCKFGDLRGAHDFYNNGGWETIRNFNSFKQIYLMEAMAGSVDRLYPEEVKNPVFNLNLGFYNPRMIDGTIRYTLDKEQMLGLFLHNLTDCSVPSCHSPAGYVFCNKISELTFETDAQDDRIPEFTNIATYTLNNEDKAIIQMYSHLTDSSFNKFWSIYCDKFESEIVQYATDLKNHVEGNGYPFTTSAWLSEKCFTSEFKMALVALYSYIEHSKNYVSATSKKPLYNYKTILQECNGEKKTYSLGPIIGLLLVD
jgi:hypothetical protein